MKLTEQENSQLCAKLFQALFPHPSEKTGAILQSYQESNTHPFEQFLLNPWELVTDYGLPFEEMRISTGLNVFYDNKFLVETFEEHQKEVYAACVSILRNNEEHGNTWMLVPEFLQKLTRFFGDIQNEDHVFSFLHYFNTVKTENMKTFFYDSVRVAFAKTKDQEDFILGKVRNIHDHSLSTTYDFRHNDIDSLCQEQNDAIRTVMSADLSILTGGPGTGKTTTINAIISEYMSQYPDRKVRLLAPTGKAAKRMEECIGGHLSAYTIHFLTLQEHYHRQGGQPENFDFFIIDESSMIDLEIFYELFHYINVQKILLVGDSDQLESVGHGNILADLIGMGVPCAVLSTNHRSGDTILENAIKVNHQNPNIVYNDHFKIFDIRYQEQVIDTYYNLQNTMILHPYRGGVQKLNTQIQKKLRPDAQEGQFYLNDRVVFLVNNRKLKYVNGDTGTIIQIGENYMDVMLDSGYTVHVPDTYYQEMSLAYALTIHKSQGSEYDTVIIVVPPGCSKYFSKNLLYTAITRAKMNVIILGQVSEVTQLIKKRMHRRNTFMRLRALRRSVTQQAT